MLNRFLKFFSLLFALYLVGLAVLYFGHYEMIGMSDDNSYLSRLMPEADITSIHSIPTTSRTPILDLLKKTSISEIAGFSTLYSLRGIPVEKDELSLGAFFKKRFKLLHNSPVEVVFRKQLSTGLTAYINFYYVTTKHERFLKTQTRVSAASTLDKTRFLAYWTVVMPFSYYLRDRILGQMAIKGERYD